MELNVTDPPSLLSDQSTNQTDKSSSASRDSLDNNDAATSEESPDTPKPHPMAFTVDFGEGKKGVDKSRLLHLAKQSQARHQRVQSMSASLHRPSPTSVTPQKPPMSAKLPRKAQGYNSEGYFSSDQEDSLLSGSVKLKQSPLASNTEIKLHNFMTSPVIDKSFRPMKSPTERKSKSPIVDNIMSRSDILPSRQSLNLPLKNTNTSSYHETYSPSYSTLSSSYQSRHLNSIIDQSPDGIMLTDISSPELDILTPDNVLSSPEHKSPKREVPDLFKKCISKNELEILEDIDRHSENSSTGTYTIEADYSEEQKARMSIDRTFGVDLLRESINEALERRSSSKERDPELVLDAKESRTRDICLRSPIRALRDIDIPKVSNDKNILEISCHYESPTEDLAAQTSKQIKSTRNYLEKIKNRVRTISEKTFQKSPPKMIPTDEGSITSVTASGVLAKYEPIREPRRLSLSKSRTDRTDFVHRLTRESSVPVSLPSKKKESNDELFESTVMRNVHAKLRDDSGISGKICDNSGISTKIHVDGMDGISAKICDDSGISESPDQIVGKLSYLSLNRCKGDKTWIQEWADSVKKYNNDTLAKTADLNSTFVVGNDKPPSSPRHHLQIKSAVPVRAGFSSGTASKIPSPVSSAYHSPRAAPETSPDTTSYLLKTQNAISNLQAKLHTRTSPMSNIPSALTSSLISEKTAASRLPVSQLSRSNSLNYRLKKKEAPSDNSPLRSPGHYVITGSNLPASTKLLIAGASRSLDTDCRMYTSRKYDSNMNSPTSDRGTNSSEDKTLSNHRPFESPRRHAMHRSFDGRNGQEYFECDNANGKVSLKTVLRNNAFEAQNSRLIEPAIRCQGDAKSRNHLRVLSDGNKKHPTPLSTIRRSSSFNTVNKNNNYIDTRIRQTGNVDDYLPNHDYSDESDNEDPYVKPQPEVRYNRALALRRDRLESPEFKSIAPANSPRCPNTPEMGRKFGPGLVRNARMTNKERPLNSRLSEPLRPAERERTPSQTGRKISDTTRQAIVNRLTKSRSTTREFQPKKQEKGGKKPNQHRSSSSLAAKEMEFTNWKKRSSYDPMKAAQEGRRRKAAKDTLASPSHSSPVHRSQSFHSTNMIDLETLDYSSEETEDGQRVSALPMDPMTMSTHSDIVRPNEYSETLRRDYVTNFHVNQPSEKLKLRSDNRKTFIIDDTTPTKENIDFIDQLNQEKRKTYIVEDEDKRKTFILDSDTNSTTNGSSPRNSSIFSHEKVSLTTGTSDTEGESGTESAPVVMRNPGGRRGNSAQAVKRHSGDYSMSSSTTSVSREPRRSIQPRYLDISRYKAESSKNFLRRDPSKTYVGALHHDGHAPHASKGSARQVEMEQKKAELEKWKRRASYDPRKAAALAKTTKPAAKTTSSVLRSQSFHGPVLASSLTPRYIAPHHIPEYDDYTSDNDF